MSKTANYPPIKRLFVGFDNVSFETYEELMGRFELYQAIEVGLNQIENGETIPEEEMLEHIRNL